MRWSTAWWHAWRKRGRDRKRRQKQGSRWFAWYPVELDRAHHKWVWLVWVWRSKHYFPMQIVNGKATGGYYAYFWDYEELP